MQILKLLLFLTFSFNIIGYSKNQLLIDNILDTLITDDFWGNIESYDLKEDQIKFLMNLGPISSKDIKETIEPFIKDYIKDWDDKQKKEFLENEELQVDAKYEILDHLLELFNI